MRVMVLRVFQTISLGMLLGLAWLLFQFKHETRVTEAHVQALHTKIAATREDIALLEAEWRFLARPERIEALAAHHLGLKPLKPGQILTWADLRGTVRDTEDEPEDHGLGGMVELKGSSDDDATAAIR